MPYKYIGRTHDFIGKTLWEILGNLKNFGVGRIVVRSRFERYPEPSYMKILKVEPQATPIEENYDSRRLVRVLVENTFRGVTSSEPIWIDKTSYKTDYKLIPKDDEQSYCRKLEKPAFESKIFPKYMEYPPLLRELIIRESDNGNVTPKMRIVYNEKIKQKHTIAEDDKLANVDISIGLGKTVSPSLYANIKVHQ